jgi:hypothetical protein
MTLSQWKYLQTLCTTYIQTHSPVCPSENSLPVTTLLPLIKTHRLLHILRPTHPSIKPSQISQHLKGLKMTSALTQCFSEFKKNDIPALLLKGPILSQQLYQNPCSRFYKDLDVWVHPSTLSKAITILQDLGYQLTTPFNIKISHLTRDVSLIHPQKKIQIELHWYLTRAERQFPLSFNEAWAMSKSLPIHTHDIHTLDDVSLYLYLCQHGSYHHWNRLNWALDICILESKLSPESISKLTHLLPTHSIRHTVYDFISLSHTLWGYKSLFYPLFSTQNQFRYRIQTHLSLFLIQQSHLSQSKARHIALYPIKFLIGLIKEPLRYQVRFYIRKLILLLPKKVSLYISKNAKIQL